MRVSTIPDPPSPLPGVDDRLVAPNTRYEILDGRVEHVAPADEPHATRHSAVDRVVGAHRASGYAIAVDMLTRTSELDDIAPDVSVYPEARHPTTGGRQLEELTFQVASTESLGHCGDKAASLTARGVRRVFAIDVSRAQVLEWSASHARWQSLDRYAHIEDRALAVPLPIAALIDAGSADAAIASALRRQRHPEFLAEHAEGHAEGRASGLAEAILHVLDARAIAVTPEQRGSILAERDPARQTRWLRVAATCASVDELIDEPPRGG
jgi:hypothetical protein